MPYPNIEPWLSIGWLFIWGTIRTHGLHLPSGNQTWQWKITILIDEESINEPFSIAMSVYLGKWIHLQKGNRYPCQILPRIVNDWQPLLEVVPFWYLVDWTQRNPILSSYYSMTSHTYITFIIGGVFWLSLIFPWKKPYILPQLYHIPKSGGSTSWHGPQAPLPQGPLGPLGPLGMVQGSKL